MLEMILISALNVFSTKKKMYKKNFIFMLGKQKKKPASAVLGGLREEENVQLIYPFSWCLCFARSFNTLAHVGMAKKKRQQKRGREKKVQLNFACTQQMCF